MDDNLLNIFMEDDCCSRRLSRVVLQGKAARGYWKCPKCGTDWRGEIKEMDGTPYRYWKPHCPVAVVHFTDRGC